MPSTAFFIKVELTKIKGSKIGKPKIANKVRLFPAFDAMVLNRLKIMAKPLLPSITLSEKIDLSAISISKNVA